MHFTVSRGRAGYARSLAYPAFLCLEIPTTGIDFLNTTSALSRVWERALVF